MVRTPLCLFYIPIHPRSFFTTSKRLHKRNNSIITMNKKIGQQCHHLWRKYTYIPIPPKYITYIIINETALQSLYNNLGDQKPRRLFHACGLHDYSFSVLIVLSTTGVYYYSNVACTIVGPQSKATYDVQHFNF